MWPLGCSRIREGVYFSDRFGILPGWYGMENGQKPEMEKKMEIKMENGPKLDRGKNGKKKNGPDYTAKTFEAEIST